MAFNKKNKRKIIVNEQEYFWCASGNDGWIGLFIMIEQQGSQKLSCKFEYHQEQTVNEHGFALRNQFVITPHIVRQVILFALQEKQWLPQKNQGVLELGHVDEKIDLKPRYHESSS
ncbi:MAG: hypothetical protein E6Q83_02190 [Thiothrix sp.]|nr:MAG: hypothetical protein E6Q83_02190 [Thiothrix sp.]